MNSDRGNVMKRIIMMILTVGIIGILLSIVISNSNTERGAANTPSNPIHIDDKEKPDKVDFSSKMTDHSAYPGVDIVTEVEQRNAYHMAIHYPLFSDDSMNKRIDDYVSEAKEAFLKEVDAKKVYHDLPPATLNIGFDIFEVMENVYSIVLNNDQYTGGANGLQTSKVFLVDLEANAFIDQAEILIDDEENHEALYHLLLKAFEESEAYQDYFFKEELENFASNGFNGYSNMYLTEDSIVFKFDEYEVTAGVAGTPEIAFSYDEMIEILTDEWKERLGLEEEEEIPIEPEDPVEKEVDQEVDKEMSVPTNKKRVALTFDDGPHPVNTLDILQLLEDYNMKATFFVLGSRVDFYPDIMNEIIARGHQIGNHTWSHKDLTTLSKQEIEEEIQLANERIERITGKKSTIYRAPYGATSNAVREVVDLTHVLWTVDTLDWLTRDPDEILKVVKDNVTDGSIILLHDIHETTVEATEMILQYLQKEGYVSVTISELNAY